MADNENSSPEQEKSDKKMRLDLSEAMPDGFDEDDEIIELKDEVTPPPQQEETEIELHEKPEEAETVSELPAVEKIIDLDALENDNGDSENLFRLSDDLAFEEEDEDAAEIPPADKEPVLKADGHDDVVEITDFEDILSEDTNEMVTLSEISEELDTAENDEDEFLELIDVEEDDPNELEESEDDIIQFDEPGTDIDDVELKDFIDDSLDEAIQIGDDFEDDLVSALGVDAGEEINLTEKTPADDEFDFSMDSSEISKKIDQLDSIFLDDVEAEAELDENDSSGEESLYMPEPEFGDNEDEIQNEDHRTADSGTNEFGAFGDEIDAENAVAGAAEIDTEDSGLGTAEIEPEDAGISAGESIDLPPAASGVTGPGASDDQMEKAIEKIIERKFSGKIEVMVTQIIEKAVSKEIQRLKQILLEDDSDEDL